MADWCRDHNLPAQRKTHLERVLQLDPDQADARRLLGYRKVKDKWMTLEEEMADKGYVKRCDGTRWMTQQDAELHDSRRQATQGRNRVDKRRSAAGGSGSTASRPNKARRTSARSTTPWPSPAWPNG